MLTKEQNEQLTRTDAGTPMGELMRRYWVPVLLSEEISSPDSDPREIKILGEELVAFRDTAGRVGVMDLYCPHRRASMALGRNEEGGLRCIYHGWKIDVDGTLLETPCEPPGSRLKDGVRHIAYPTHEAAGIVWAYLGPEEHRPPFPDFTCLTVADDGSGAITSARKMWEACNWAQAYEGAIDSFHSGFLHSGFEVLHWTPEQIARVYNRPSRGLYGPIDCEDTEYGFRYAAIRTPTVDPEVQDYVRITEFVFPFFFLTPPDIGSSASIGAFVPIDDYNTMAFSVFIGNEPGVVQYRRTRAPNAELDSEYKPLRNRANNYGQDRQMMRRRETGTSFSGIDTSPAAQDLAVVETMGAISDRTREHLGASDIGIAGWRRRVLAALDSFSQGDAPPAIDPPAPFAKIKSSAGMIPKGSGAWKSLTWDA
jgi:phthalate 4,5-dioxygenase oxygenase subunit